MLWWVLNSPTEAQRPNKITGYLFVLLLASARAGSTVYLVPLLMHHSMPGLMMRSSGIEKRERGLSFKEEKLAELGW